MEHNEQQDSLPTLCEYIHIVREVITCAHGIPIIYRYKKYTDIMESKEFFCNKCDNTGRPTDSYS